MAKLNIYLDHAAATPLDNSVVAVMQPYFSQKFYNPSAQYRPARQIAADISEARARVAHWLGAKNHEVVFTAGGTEANNLAINGIMQLYPKSNIVISAIEHESVIEPAAQYDVRLAPVLADGRLDMAQLENLIDANTVLVSIMYANNEIGTIEPLREVAALVSKARQTRGLHGKPIYLHSDAAQAANYLDLHVSRLGVDLMTINGGKIYGPKQSGALYIKAPTQLKPQILGGGQERNLRSGTEAVANIIGFSKALDLVQTKRGQEVKRLNQLQKLFLKLLSQKIPVASVNGSLKQRLPNNINVTIPNQSSERLLLKLDQAGVYCAAGSACSAASDDPSHVLLALGLSETEARCSLRFTLGQSSDEVAVKQTVEILSKNIS